MVLMWKFYISLTSHVYLGLRTLKYVSVRTEYTTHFSLQSLEHAEIS